jgi:hypothetical protein
MSANEQRHAHEHVSDCIAIELSNGLNQSDLHLPFELF